MRMTYSTASQRAEAEAGAGRLGVRRVEFVALVAASAIVLVGLVLVFQAKAPGVAAAATKLAGKPATNLNEVSRAEELLPALEPVIVDSSERRFVAERITAYLSAADERSGARRDVPAVGALALISVGEADIGKNRRAPSLRARLNDRTSKPGSRDAGGAALRVPLLTAAELADLKPRLVVRSSTQFRTGLLWSTILLLAGFYVAHGVARWRRSTADPWLLPAIHLLCGIGVLTMISLRDPLRDTALYVRFAQGTAGGCLVLAAMGFVDFQRSVLRRLSFVPLAGAVALSLLLVAFGSGPGASDAKVNLLGVQPVEAIRLLVVFFLAGYFANRWEFLRELTEPRFGRSPWFAGVPRLDYVLPVLVGMAVLLVFFFLQKDLGPALTLACVFLAMYGVARRRVTMVTVGLAVLLAGFAAGYWLGFPATVVQRVEMWRSPWNNAYRGGSQIAHALWALASGGWSGAGLGLGDPRFVPAGHTDLVLAAVGEELGLAGMLALIVLAGFVAHRALRIALRAPGDFTFFLALGLTLNLVLQFLLIAAGLLGLLPLTGVATPFLSYGRSSMVANLAAVGILLATSARSPGKRDRPEFAAPVAWVSRLVVVLLAVVAARLVYVQLLAADRLAGAPALTVQADGGLRFEYNPRLLAAAREIVRGTITDRNGIPLATSRPEDLAAHDEELAQLGVVAAEACPSSGERCYPFGGVMFHVLGDWRTELNWAAPNTSFVERDSDPRLRGYDDRARSITVVDPRTGASTVVLRRDLREIVPLLRYRYRPGNAAVKRLLERPRDVRTTVDIRLQLKAAALLRDAIVRAGKEKGALVVLSDTGELLAAVSYPWPHAPGAAAVGAGPAPQGAGADLRLLDRARYGMYPPGSSFKIVTAAAALRSDPALKDQTFTCQRLPDGRVGAPIRGWARPIRDDPADRVPHGTLAMERALIVSCNAYFAQLGLKLGAEALMATAAEFEVSLGQPETLRQVRDMLPFAAYGQGQVLVTPFKMARVAATIATGGAMPQGRWILDEGNTRTDAPRTVLEAADAALLGRTLRRVVLEGTGRVLRQVEPPVAGKTGTAEVADAPSHSWFAGYAPYGAAGPKIAFAVIVENGGYGAGVAAPIAGQVVAAARDLGIVGR